VLNVIVLNVMINVIKLSVKAPKQDKKFSVFQNRFFRLNVRNIKEKEARERYFNVSMTMK
jgi:hypothetical protein